MNIVFESKNILFVKVSPSFAEDYLKMVNDKEVTRFFEARPAYTLEQEIKWANSKLAEDSICYSMVEKGSLEFIGNIELMDVDEVSKELGIIITLDKQNKGYGTEAILAILNYAKEVLGLHKVVLRANPLNIRAIHVYEKCGFSYYNKTSDKVYMQIIFK